MKPYGRPPVYSEDFKKQWVRRYLTGTETQMEVALAGGFSKPSLVNWLAIYRREVERELEREA